MDTLGMDSDTPVNTPEDVNVLAWRRYDELATSADCANRDYEQAVYYAQCARYNILSIDNLADAAVLTASTAASAQRDIEALKGECECSDDGLTTCSKCVAYARVIGWSNQRTS